VQRLSTDAEKPGSLVCANSGKHKIVPSCSNERLDFGSGTKEAVMPKKKFIAPRNLKDWTKFTTHINEKTKTIAVFLTRHFCASLTNGVTGTSAEKVPLQMLTPFSPKSTFSGVARRESIERAWQN